MASIQPFKRSEMATMAGTAAQPNEDYAVVGPDWAIVLDGATHSDGVATGCRHDVPWLVSHLAAALVEQLVLSAADLPESLANAIDATCTAHAGSCDLSNPDSPSSTVAMVRARENAVEYLVLGDSPVIFQTGDEIQVKADDRVDQLEPNGRPYSPDVVRSKRNACGGFWVASTNPEAAFKAVSGFVESPSSVALLTDGVTRLKSCYEYDWPDILSVLDQDGPAGLIQRVRQAERRSPQPVDGLGKRHDDATAVYIRLS